MKKIAVAVFAITLLSLTSCLEMGESTTINKDGSGMLLYTVDMSGALKMAFEKDGGDKQPFQNVAKIDTTIYLRDVTRGMELSEENKRLLKEMMVKTQFDLTDHANPVFKFSIVSVFGNLDDLNAMAILIRDKPFAPVVEKAFTAIPSIDEKDMKEFGEMMQFIFRGMYKTTYKQGLIESSLDTTANIYKEMGLGKPSLRESLESMPEDGDVKMIKSANFTTLITLPVPPKEIKGTAITKGANDKQIVLKGNIFEMLKDPQQYEYRISY